MFYKFDGLDNISIVFDILGVYYDEKYQADFLDLQI